MRNTYINSNAGKGKPNPVDEHVGRRLRGLRTMSGDSQESLANAIGMTFQQIQKYEKGANRIAMSRIFDICQAYGVDANYFFEKMPDSVRASSPYCARLGVDKPQHIANDPALRRRTMEIARILITMDDDTADAVFTFIKAMGKRDANR